MNAASIDTLYEIYEILCQLTNYFHVQLEQGVLSKIEKISETACADHQTTVISDQVSKISSNEISKSFFKSVDELTDIYGAKLKYLLKFSEKLTVPLETDLANLRIN